MARISQNTDTGRARADSYRICTECPIHHVENCNTCFGFGVYSGKKVEYVPISAHEASSKTYPDDWCACPECGSTPFGQSAADEGVDDDY